MSEPTERPPSHIPVPWPFHPPHELEPSHPLYNHVPHDRDCDHDRQAAVQSQWDAEWAEFDREYQQARQQARSRGTRREQIRHHPVTSPVPPQPHQRQPDHGQQAAVQGQWDAEWAEFDRQYQQARQQARSRGTRREQIRHHPVTSPVPPQPHQRQPDHGQQAAVQGQWDAEWAEFDRQYQQARQQARREQTHHHTAAPPVHPQSHQRQPEHGDHEPLANPCSSGGGRERWRYLGRDYVRDSPGSEWVEVPKPVIHPVTDTYGFAPGDPMYRPDLRYTPREVDDGDGQGGQAAMPPPQSGNGHSGGHAQPINYGNATNSGPRLPSPPPMPYRSRDMPRNPGPAGNGYSGPPQPLQQDQYHDPGYPTQSNVSRPSAEHAPPVRPDAAQPYHPAPSHAPADRLETREDLWEFLFGSKGYTTLAPGDERPFWWDWKD